MIRIHTIMIKDSLFMIILYLAVTIYFASPGNEKSNTLPLRIVVVALLIQ